MSAVPFSTEAPAPAGAINAVLCDVAPALDRFCTPSLLQAATVADVAGTDLSISYGPAGTMLTHDGVFAEAESFIADVQGADRAFLVTGGSTQANQIALRAVARAGLVGAVVFDRQVHHSCPNAATMFGLRWRYIETASWHRRFESPAAMRVADVAELLDGGDDIAALVVVSPTYLGQVADIGAIAALLAERSPSTALIVDEAWGAHLAFHPSTAPLRAAVNGAHLISQSTHKQAGALQPGAVLLHNDGPIPAEVVDAAYLDLTSTSASFHIAGSVEAAHRILAADGAELLGHSIRMAARLADGIATTVSGAAIWDGGARSDRTKVTIALPYGTFTGYDVEQRLVEFGIVPEKSTIGTISFLLNFGTARATIDRTIDVVASTIAELQARPGEPRATVTNPFKLLPARPAVDPAAIATAPTILVPFIDAVGAVAAETVEAYPPGVAVIGAGFQITADALSWLINTAEAGGRIVGRDPALSTLSVLA